MARSTGSTRIAASTRWACRPPPADPRRSSTRSQSRTPRCAKAATTPSLASRTWTVRASWRHSASRRCHDSAGQLFWEGSDHELGLACVHAYNDWMIDEWSASAPGRLIPLIILPLWDPEAAAAEIERCAGMGARGLAFSENPEPLGLPTIYDPDGYWDPVFASANDTEMVVCTHIGSSSSMPATSKGAPHLVSKAWRQGAVPSATMMDWLFCGVFQRFENLKLALSEGGIGWIPFFLQSCRVHPGSTSLVGRQGQRLRRRVRSGRAGGGQRGTRGRGRLRHVGRAQPLRRPCLRMLHRRRGRDPRHRPHRYRQRHGRDGLPAQRLDLAQHHRRRTQTAARA